jgi:hypothetical protein
VGYGSMAPARPRCTAHSLTVGFARASLAHNSVGGVGEEHDLVEEACVRQIIGEQVHVRGEGEGGRVVAEPELHLLGIQPVAEEHGRAGVAEGVEACPGHAREPGCRLEVAERGGRVEASQDRAGSAGSEETPVASARRVRPTA